MRLGLRSLPGRMAGLEASLPWLCYWMLHSLELLNGLSSIPARQLEATVDFLISLQHPTGGFGGGHGHAPHVLSTYAAVLSLCILGHELKCFPAVVARIDRAGLRAFYERMKVTDPNDESYGGFRVCDGGEIDTRAVFGVAIVASLLDVLRDNWADPVPSAAAAAAFAATRAGSVAVLPQPATVGISSTTGSPAAAGGCALMTGTVAWLSRCQTWEGGIAAEPGNEAHGGYAYCGLAVLLMLGAPDAVDLDGLLKWATLRQVPYEGGFSGRSNKLVDSCYSFWVGILFPLIHEAKAQIADRLANTVLGTTVISGDSANSSSTACAAGVGIDAAGEVERVAARYRALAGTLPETENGWLFDQRAMQTYIFGCCQDPTPAFGLRDKPGKGVDFYHTCYGLSGLSVAQHSLSSLTEAQAAAAAKEHNANAAAAVAASAAAAAAAATESANSDGDVYYDPDNAAFNPDSDTDADGAKKATAANVADAHDDTASPATFAAFSDGFSAGDGSAPVSAAATASADAAAGGACLKISGAVTIGAPDSLLQPTHRIYNVCPAVVDTVFAYWGERAAAAAGAAGAAGVVVEVDDE